MREIKTTLHPLKEYSVGQSYLTPLIINNKKDANYVYKVSQYNTK